MKFETLPCHRCPQHRKYLKRDASTSLAEVVHTCGENWYARVQTADSAPADEDDDDTALAPLNRQQLLEFWNLPRHYLFSCPYRREKFVYRAIPLIVSTLALIVSLLNMDAVKSRLGLTATNSKPIQVEQPVKVAIQGEPLKVEQPVRVTMQATPAEVSPQPSATVDATQKKRGADKPRD